MVEEPEGKKDGKPPTFVLLVYGPSGIGKSVDQGYSFPKALYIAAPGALSSIESVCGYKPKSIELPTVMEATELIEAAASKYKTVVIDDFSFLVEQTFSRLEKAHAGYKLWGALRDVVLKFRNVSRYAGVSVVLNAWESAPKVKPNGSRVRGGPQLSGNLVESLPAMCDVVLRAVHEPSRRPWPACYRCSADPSWVMKDRFDVTAQTDPAPMNLGELMRASGHVIERLLPGQEEEVQTISELLTGVPQTDAPIVNEMYRKMITSGRPVWEAKWTMRDAVDRAVIHKVLSEARLRFFDESLPQILT